MVCFFQIAQQSDEVVLLSYEVWEKCVAWKVLELKLYQMIPAEH